MKPPRTGQEGVSKMSETLVPEAGIAAAAPIGPALSRVSSPVLEQQRAAVEASPRLVQLLDAYPGPVALLNGSRQIVAANAALAAVLGRTPGDLIGLRVGEAVGCVHSAEDPEGCGTAEACRYCGAAQAMACFERNGQPCSGECHIALESAAGPDALDLRVWARPLAVADETYMLFSIQDIAAEKRRAVLERLFFHDVLNTAGAIRGMLELLPPVNPAEDEFRAAAVQLSGALIEEIQAQRELLAAERGDLVAEPESIDVAPLLQAIRAALGAHPVGQGKSIEYMCPPRARVHADRTLLRRVLVNLAKNALEASSAGQPVSIVFEALAQPRFHVHNLGAMPPAVQAQIFQRSFSTKGGHGRGVGTHSVRLLTQRYLGGDVWFVSNPDEGTTFTVQLPAPSSA